MTMFAHALECQRTWWLNMAKTVFAITISFLAISSILRNLAKMKEFKDDEGKLFVLLSVLRIAQHPRKHARIQGSCQKFPKIMHILSTPSKPHSFHSVGSRIHEQNDILFIPKME